jgi:hypothetical protein
MDAQQRHGRPRSTRPHHEASDSSVLLRFAVGYSSDSLARLLLQGGYSTAL